MSLGRREVLARLDGYGLLTRTVEHPAVFTVEEAQAHRGEIPGGHAKNLFVKDKKDRLFLIVAEEETAIDLKAVSSLIGAKGRVSFGRPDLLMEVLGVEPGSVNPFAVLNDTAGAVTVVLDTALLVHDPLNFHPMVNTATTSIARDDFLRFLELTGHPPLIVSFAVAGSETHGGGSAAGA